MLFMVRTATAIGAYVLVPGNDARKKRSLVLMVTIGGVIWLTKMEQSSEKVFCVEKL